MIEKKNELEIFKSTSVENYIFSSLAVGCASIGFVTVIGLPIEIAASVVSKLCGITTIILTTFQKKYHEDSIKEMELYSTDSKLLTD